MTRRERYLRECRDQPSYRERQLFCAFFQPAYRSIHDNTTLPLSLKEEVASWPWLTVSEKYVLESTRHDTWKALLEIDGSHLIETVLMKNARGFWSICVSSQVGCAMACTFCATGKMGLKRNLTADEIIDQYRFWMYFLDERRDLEQRITNVVYMGMGEPLANYEAVRESLQTLLTYTDIGPTRITVSTVGLLPALKRTLKDPEWPPVRLAISLHSADASTRSDIMPSSYPRFLDDLGAWTREYFIRFDSRRRHLTFEYVMLAGVNDTLDHAKKLVAFARKVGKIKINLIPYNDTKTQYSMSAHQALSAFKNILRDAHVDVTERRTMGADIAAACGQLVVLHSGRKTPQRSA